MPGTTGARTTVRDLHDGYPSLRGSRAACARIAVTMGEQQGGIRRYGGTVEPFTQFVRAHIGTGSKSK